MPTLAQLMILTLALWGVLALALALAPLTVTDTPAPLTVTDTPAPRFPWGLATLGLVSTGALGLTVAAMVATWGQRGTLATGLATLALGLPLTALVWGSVWEEWRARLALAPAPAPAPLALALPPAPAVKALPPAPAVKALPPAPLARYADWTEAALLPGGRGPAARLALSVCKGSAAGAARLLGVSPSTVRAWARLTD